MHPNVLTPLNVSATSGVAKCTWTGATSLDAARFQVDLDSALHAFVAGVLDCIVTPSSIIQHYHE